MIFLGHATDICWSIVFMVFFVFFVFLQIYIAVFSISNGDAMRLVYGYDSYGNTCDELNNPIPNVTLSGQNMKGRPWVLLSLDFAPGSLVMRTIPSIQ